MTHDTQNLRPNVGFSLPNGNDSINLGPNGGPQGRNFTDRPLAPHAGFTQNPDATVQVQGQASGKRRFRQGNGSKFLSGT